MTKTAVINNTFESNYCTCSLLNVFITCTATSSGCDD